jgi:hypothetical protein
MKTFKPVIRRQMQTKHYLLSVVSQFISLPICSSSIVGTAYTFFLRGSVSFLRRDGKPHQTFPTCRTVPWLTVWLNAPRHVPAFEIIPDYLQWHLFTLHGGGETSGLRCRPLLRVHVSDLCQWERAVCRIWVLSVFLVLLSVALIICPISEFTCYKNVMSPLKFIINHGPTISILRHSFTFSHQNFRVNLKEELFSVLDSLSCSFLSWIKTLNLPVIWT